jgi:hypothetical protein
MTREANDADSNGEDSYLARLVPQVADHLAAQQSEGFDAEAIQSRFHAWLAEHTEGPAGSRARQPQGMQGPQLHGAQHADTGEEDSTSASGLAGSPGPAGTTGRLPRIFISYAHDSDPHVESVRAFAEFLLQSGLDVRLDLWELYLRHDWSLWVIEQMRRADYIVVIASPMCRLAGDGEQESTRLDHGQHLMLLRELLHSDRNHWTSRLLPVVLPGGSVSDLPLFLQPWTGDHYLIDELTIPGAEDLLRVMTSPPESHS